MKRFLIVNFTDLNLNSMIRIKIKENGYKELTNPYLRVDENLPMECQGFVCLVDTINKEYCWATNDSDLVNTYFLSKFENVNKLSYSKKDISLEEIIKLSDNL